MNLNSNGWLAFLAVLLTHHVADSSRYRQGNYPKRSEGEDYLSADAKQNTQLNRIGDILRDIAQILDAISLDEVSANEQTTPSITAEEGTTPSAASVKPPSVDELKNLEEKLSKVLNEKTKKALEVDPHPRAPPTYSSDSNFKRTLSKWMQREIKPITSEDDEDYKFKRVLTKWMERDLGKGIKD